MSLSRRLARLAPPEVFQGLPPVRTVAELRERLKVRNESFVEAISLKTALAVLSGGRELWALREREVIETRRFLGAAGLLTLDDATATLTADGGAVLADAVDIRRRGL